MSTRGRENTPTTLIAATTLLGGWQLVPESSLRPRRSAYGVVISDGRLLLVNTRSTGKWSFPGGRREAGESDAAAAIREIREETGIVVTIDAILAEVASCWYDDTTGAAYRQTSIFFRCRPVAGTLDDRRNPDPDDQAEDPTWVPLATLAPDDFQGYWGAILQLIRG